MLIISSIVSLVVPGISETMAFSNKKNISDHDRQIAELRREVVQIKKAYNSLLKSLESRDKELFEILGKINKNVAIIVEIRIVGKFNVNEVNRAFFWWWIKLNVVTIIF